ncbi:MAG: insulinase family protein, partial [Pseudomonas sp.]
DIPARELDLRLQPGLKVFRLQDSESGSYQVNLMFRGRYQVDPADGQRERLLDRIATRMLLIQLQRQPRPQGVTAYTMQRVQIGQQSEVVALAASLQQSVHEQALQGLLTEVQRLRCYGFYQRDLDREKDKLRRVADDMLARGDARDFADWVQQLSDPSQADRPIQTRSTIAKSSLRLIDSIRLEEINQRVKRWTDSDDRVLQLSAPDGQALALPTVERYQTLLAGIDVAALAAPQPEAKPAPHVVVPPLPKAEHAGSVVAVKRYDAERVQYWTLSNGDRLVWLRRAGGDGKANLQIESASGYRQVGGKSWLEQSASQLVWSSPPQGFDERQWQAWQARERMSLSQDQQALQTRFSAETEAKRLGDLMALYRARVTQPQVPDDAVEQLRNDLARHLQPAPLKTRETQERALAQLRYGPQPSGLPSAAEAAALSRADLLHTWARQMAVPVTYYLSADIDEADLRQWVSRELAGIPRGAVAQGEPLLQQPGVRQARLANAIEPRATLQVLGYAERAWTPEDAVRVSTLRQLANAALKERLRGEARGLYQLTFESELNPATQRLETRLLFTCDPQRLDELWQQAEAVLRALPSQITPERVATVRRELQRDEGKRQQDSATQLHRLILSDQRWGDPRYLSSQAHLDQALQVQPLRELAGQLLSAANRVRLDIVPRTEPDA